MLFSLINQSSFWGALHCDGYFGAYKSLFDLTKINELIEEDAGDIQATQPHIYSGDYFDCVIIYNP